MMDQISQAATILLFRLRELMAKLNDEQYCKKVELLSDASIGQHTRHIIEFFQELENGYKTGLVNYDARKRNFTLETQRSFAISELVRIAEGMSKENRSLRLITDLGGRGENLCEVSTEYNRELLFNIEHTVHHMALLKIAAGVVTNIVLPENFGVAVATIKYRSICVQ